MVKPVQKAEISSFVKGLISEASPLNFPADACRDIENFELNKDGSLQRRLGLDLEPDFQVRTTGYSAAQFPDVAHSSFRWVGAAGDVSNEFGVVQFGKRIDIYDLTADSLSSDGFLQTIDLESLLYFSHSKFSYAAIDGVLVIATGEGHPIFITYDGSSFFFSTDRLLVRDLWGVPDGLDLNERPQILSNEHHYNLHNQGWGVPRKSAGGLLMDPIYLYSYFFSVPDSDNVKQPSNSETVYTGLKFQPVQGGETFERLYPNLFEEQLGLNIQAAKGYFIIDVLARGNSRQAEVAANYERYPELLNSITGLRSDYTLNGPKVVTDFAGRVFYSGFGGEVISGYSTSPNLSDFVLFSQAVRSKEDIVKCYQAGDPTSREGSDIVDTDGGFIKISGAKNIVSMKGMSNNLFIIAENGVWGIAGGSDFGFAATNYRVDKLSSFGCFAPDTVVEVGDKILFWGEEGIFAIAKNQVGEWVVTSLSQKTIQKVYDAIPSESRRNARAMYDALDKKIRWLYEEDSFKKEIILDLVLGSFSKTKIFNTEENSPEVLGYLNTPSFSANIIQDAVIANEVLVTASGEQVIVFESTASSRTLSFKFVTLFSTVSGKVGYTFSRFQDGLFRDWFSADLTGVDSPAFLLTGTITGGDSSVFKQVPYLIMHFLRTEEGVVEVDGELVPDKQSSCKIRSQWNWSDSIISGNWGNLFQAYRYRRPLFIVDSNDEYDNGFETVVTKNKLRGRGRALSIFMQTEPLKDCHILGWNLSLTGNSLA